MADYMHLKDFNQMARELIAEVSNGDADERDRAEAEKELRALLRDCIFDCGPDNEWVRLPLARLQIGEREMFPLTP